MRVFNVPASAPFLRSVIAALVDGVLVPGFDARANPARLSEATLYLPTRRACRMARETFLDVLDVEAAVLPRIVPIGDIDEDELDFAAAASGATALDLPPALDALERRLVLARLIAAWAQNLPKDPGHPELVVTGPVSALGLADDLARLIDDMETRQVPWTALDGVVEADVDVYWQMTLGFLNNVVRTHWPAVLADLDRMEPARRRDLLIAAEAQRLAHAPGPVIAAGSTGSMPATAMFLEAVAKLPQGAVVLPGLDTILDEESWTPIAGDGAAKNQTQKNQIHPAPSHPQFALRALLARIGLARAEVKDLVGAAVHGRETLMSEAMRPAATTARWRTRLAQPDIAAALARGLDTVSVIAAANPEDEALAIAVALREAVERPALSAALVTPDRALARRVKAALARWSVAVDDSGGDALMETRAGIFARLAAEAALDGLAPSVLLALLKHPHFRLGRAPNGFRDAIAALEMALLRGTRPPPGCDGLRQALAAFRDEWRKLQGGQVSAIHPSEPRAALTDDALEGAQQLVDALYTALQPLEALSAFASHDIAKVAAAHRAVLESLAIDNEAGFALFGDADGTALATAFDDLAIHGATAALRVAAGDYVEALMAALGERIVRRPALAEARVRIYGPLEARLTPCDRVILGGLVEGVWPPQMRADPWLNRTMRSKLGLDLPERRIGLSAHDFAQLMGAPEVILSHAAKVGGAPAVASRFVHRLEAVAGEEAWARAVARGQPYLDWARALDRPATVAPAPRPEPKPPRAARPTKLSVTEIEHWLRDPYTIYARRILKLARLDPIDLPLGAADRGSFIHDAIGDFTRQFAAALPASPYDELIALGRARFAPLADQPEARALWWPRYQRIAAWFGGWERQRRDELAHVHAEIGGQLQIALGARVFTLTARADRIEQRSDARYTILDYKTGVVPTGKQVVIGLSPQLPLEAAILRAGGFADIPAKVSVAALTYVKLSGNDPAGEERPLELTRDRRTERLQLPDDVADDARRKLEELIEAFEDEGMPYRSLVLSMWRARYGTYDDLARVKEWSASGGLSEDGGDP